jgi:DNA-damage-inducible protein D
MSDNSEEVATPDFESIKQVNPYGAEYWSARDLAPLLGYGKWQNFEVAIERAMTACEQVGQVVADQFTGVSKLIDSGKGAKRPIKDYLLSRFACYLIAQNGDPRKKEIAEAQAYFAISTRRYEISQLLQEQEERLKLREHVNENNKALAQAATQAGVLSPNFGLFQDAGYKGLYGGLGVADIKEHKQIPQREDLLDRMGRAELAANDFRITQTEERLRKDGTIGQTKAMDVHREVGKKVRKAIEDIGGTMPEDLTPEPSIKPLLDAKRRKEQKRLKRPQPSLFDMPAPEDNVE